MKRTKERGITLIALIITIIVLVILAAVSISVAYKSKVIDYATESSQDYTQESIVENKIMEGTTKLLDSTVNRINDIIGGNGEILEPTTPIDPKPEEPEEPKPKELTKEELAKEEMIGKYVDYKSAGTNYTVNRTYSGASSNQTFSTNNDMKWRIWGVEGNELLLISETLAGSIILKGANGYNNIVRILNDACSTAFGNTTDYGEGVITARSINQDDIDKVTNMTTDSQRKAISSRYGNSDTKTGYPKIYEQEPSKTGGGSLDRSKQTSWYTGTTSSSFTGKFTSYSYKISDYAILPMYDVLLTNPTENSSSGTTNNEGYWCATRCTSWGGTDAFQFEFFHVRNGRDYSQLLYSTYGSTPYDWDLYVRPMVSIKLDAVTVTGILGGDTNQVFTLARK